MHQYLGHFSYVIISVDRSLRMKRSEATSSILAWCSVEYRSRTRVNSSIPVLAWEETLYRLFPQVLHKKRKQVENEKRTIAGVKETEKPQHCIFQMPKLSNDVSLETKAYPEFYMFRHKFSLLVVGPTQCGKTFFFEKILITDRILYESKKSRRIWWVLQSVVG